jgi:hypothetical protein
VWCPMGTFSKTIAHLGPSIGRIRTWANPHQLGWTSTGPAQEVAIAWNSIEAVTGEGPVGSVAPPLHADAQQNAREGTIARFTDFSLSNLLIVLLRDQADARP